MCIDLYPTWNKNVENVDKHLFSPVKYGFHCFDFHTHKYSAALYADLLYRILPRFGR